MRKIFIEKAQDADCSIFRRRTPLFRNCGIFFEGVSFHS
eukprot:UN12008